MISEKSIEKLEPSAARLSVKIPAEDAGKAYQELLADYMKKSHVKGFRPGKAPAAVLESKFGESLRFETAQKLVDESLQEIFAELEEKPLGIEPSNLEGNLEFDPGKDFHFTVTYDVFPKVEMNTYQGLSIEEPQVKIEKEDIDRELEAIREQNSLVADKTEGKPEDGDIVTLYHIELDENGQAIEESAREDVTFTIGRGQYLYQLDEDVKTMSLNETKVVEKTYGEDAGQLAGKTLKLQIELERIRVRELPDLDDELAQDVDENYKTLDDLKKGIQSRMEKNLKDQIRQKKMDALMNLLIEKNPVQLPESLVRAEVNLMWKNWLRQFAANEEQVEQIFGQQSGPPDQVVEDLKPQATRNILSQVIVNKLLEIEKIEAEQAEIDAEIEEQIKGSNMDLAEAKDHFEKNGYLEMIENTVRERKLFDRLFELNTVKKGPKVKLVDLKTWNT